MYTIQLTVRTVFISQYRNKVDFISMGEVHMGAKWGQAQTGGRAP